MFDNLILNINENATLVFKTDVHKLNEFSVIITIDGQEMSVTITSCNQESINLILKFFEQLKMNTFDYKKRKPDLLLNNFADVCRAYEDLEKENKELRDKLNFYDVDDKRDTEKDIPVVRPAGRIE